ncbi:MAG: YihY/virulence factor BrkB family protein [Deltaproteobacteria bacterium]|nr:YihY/virulence factor BrkB family protein [Deltaproteobacteria bacterium]
MSADAPSPGLLSWLKGLGGWRSAGRGLTLAAWKFLSDRGFLRASALTYSTLLSLVPLLALTFSVLKGLGVQRRIEPLILERIAAGNQEIVASALSYVDRTQVTSLGVLGLAGLLFTSVSVLANIELSFNDIWQIRRGRSVLRMVTDYAAILVVTPVLLLTSLSLTTTLHSFGAGGVAAVVGPAVELLLRASPFVATGLAFTAAYLILPNRRIPVASACVGGAFAGLLWHLAEWAYVRFQFGIVGYNAIYGTMAQLPVLLVWVYTSWCIVLLGAEVACVHEGPISKGARWREEELWSPRLSLALRALLLAARPFEGGERGPTTRELYALLRLSPGQGLRLLERLERMGLVKLTGDEPPVVVPGRSPDRVRAADLLQQLAGFGPDDPEEPIGLRLRRALEGELGDRTWADLAQELLP